MLELLRAADPPTGVFTSNFNQAIGALAAARESGCRVPEDLSLITYDDDPISAYLAPPLTGIRMPMHEMGIAAVDAILDRIEGKPTSDLTVATPPEIIVRNSTAPPGRR
jgi:DNA-binding LacI/PurR family transcriptional regulator